MSLTEELLTAAEQGKNIVIADDKSSCTTTLEKRINNITRTDTDVRREPRDALDVTADDYVIIHADDCVRNPKETFKAATAYQTVTESKADGIITTTGPLKGNASDEDSSFGTAMKQTIRSLTGSRPTIYGIEKSLQEQLESLTEADLNHGLRALHDAKFKEILSQKFTEGNLQSQHDTTFGIISDRVTDNGGKFDIIDPDSAETNDLDQYAGVLIDNNYQAEKHDSFLGDGLDVLKRISTNTPVFYQSSHQHESFSDAERKRIRSHGGILIGKNVAPKLYDDEQRAQNALHLDDILSQHAELDRNTADILPVGDGYVTTGDKHITFSKRADRDTNPSSLEQTLLEQSGYDTSTVNHQLYVLSQWHTKLQPDKVDTWESQSTDFYDWDTIDDAIPNSIDRAQWYKEHLKDTYQTIVEKHRDIDPTVLMHGDAKADNWFNDAVLGDFGSSGLGTHYKDLAKTLGIQPPNEDEPSHRQISRQSFDTERVEHRLRRYHDLRKSLDEDYTEPFTQLKQRTYEHIITESLRTAMYKARAGETEYAESLLRLSSNYQNTLRRDVDLNPL